jgi:serine/threonine protein kinase
MRLPDVESAALKELPDSPVASAARALPAGAWLGEFEVEATISEGSVAIVYAATDRALAVPVAISEYMPARLAQRNDVAQVTPRTPAQVDAFAKGLKAFINETRTLARCDHPSLVRVVRLWEANATAYRVMPRYSAKRLLEARRGMTEPPDEEAVRALLGALLGALQAFHHAGGCHAKVTPSNILLMADNRPLLLGPGVAGRAIAGDQIDVLITSGEPCFAPIEQIVEADTPLHPSVDLYALAGVARYWMSGELPAPALGASSTARPETLADTVQRLHLTWPRLRYSASLLNALDSALSIYPAERPQNVAQMRARLDAAPPDAGGLSAPSAPASAHDDDVPSSPVPQAAPPAHVEADLDPVTAFASDPDHLATSGFARIDDDPSVRAAFARQMPGPRRIAMWSGVVLAVLALLLVGMYEFRQEHQVGRVLDVLGISRGTGAGESGAVSASARGPAAPVIAPLAANAGAAKPMPTEPTGADSPAGATAPAPQDSPNRATLEAAATAPAAAEQPTAPAPPPARVAQQSVSRGPASPREACGARTQFSLYRCMQTQCSQRQWASHAQCERLRTTDSVD